MNAKSKVMLESLESREVPALFGTPWANADELTLSFAPNGVSTSNQLGTGSSVSSDLFSTLGKNLSTTAWQDEVLKAYYRWTEVANINIGLTADNGQSFGAKGFAETGTLPADLRVGAILQSSEVAATSTPNHPLAGLRAGNTIFNSAKEFNKGGTGGKLDLYSVSLHEAANALGLEDNDSDPTSVRFGHYNGVRTGLNSGDVAAIKAMYGDRPNDQFEGNSGNATTAAASSLTADLDPWDLSKYRALANGSITTSSDVDVYKVTTRSDTNSLTVRLGTAGRSLLAGSVEILDSKGKVVATKSNTTPLQGDTLLSWSGAKASTTYFVRVKATSPSVYAVGTYQLRIGYNYDPVKEIRPNRTQPIVVDAASTQSSAMILSTTTGYTANTFYQAAEEIQSASDVDYFRVTAPASANTLTVTVLGRGGVNATATVYSSSGQLLASNVLLNAEDGMYRAQISDVVAGNYFVKVNLTDAAANATTGEYLLQADFISGEASRVMVTSNVLNPNNLPGLGIEVIENRAYTFGLTANTSAVVEMTIYNSSGNIVARQQAQNGLSSLTIYLMKGKYTVSFTAPNSLTPLPTTAYSLSVFKISDPIDVYPPNSPPPPPSNGATDPGFTTDPNWQTAPGYYNPWLGLNPVPPTSPPASPPASPPPTPTPVPANSTADKLYKLADYLM